MTGNIVMFDILGSGALNLDIFYEIDDLSAVRKAGFDLHPGHEISGSHKEARRLVEFLDQHGMLKAKSGGGSSANTICALSALGWNTAFAGFAGDDPEGDFILSSMKGVDSGSIVRGGKSAVCVVVIEKKKRDRAMFVAPVEISLLRKAHHAFLKGPSQLPPARIVHLSSLVQDEGLKYHEKLTGSIHEDVLLTLDPGEIYAKKGIPALSDILKRVDILFITEEEIDILTPPPNSPLRGEARWGEREEGIRMLLSMLHERSRWIRQAHHKIMTCLEEAGGPVLVCKMGKRGAMLRSRRLSMELPAEKVERIVDNTGAGDAFNAGFLDGVLRGSSLKECLKKGIDLAALSLSGYGRDWLNSVASGQ